MVPERFVVNFKPGKVMEDRVKRLKAKTVSEAIAEAMELERQAQSNEAEQVEG